MGKQALGRGLSAIFGAHGVSNNPINNQVANSGEQVDKSKQIVDINLDLVDPNPYQPRKTFDDDKLQELAETIKKHGLIQPIAVRKVGGRYQIISGERRTRASRLAKCATIKAQIYDSLDDKEMNEWALIENIQREDLNPIEVAQSYQQLIDNHSYTHEDLAKTVGKSRSAITNALRLLKLPAQVQAWIQEGKLSGGAARALCSVENPEALAKRVIEEGLNVRQIEAISRGENIDQTGNERRETNEGEDQTKPEVESKPKRELSADMKNFESRLETFFGTKVSLNPNGADQSKGTIVINYYSMDDLTRIQELMENR
ncbi:MAG: ParB/RepB/Spo0J family partition protein [Fibrobacter sp.]|jgi:ParB family chromosome partitioning protein|uniref:ParB/RepB/Spo0J family partition protein n=1 Tax=Fibrobacter sp. UWP2 TaxID=1896216 RepID=UPI00091D6873|nr:ParB/RepB/Spo0J family partition protein [Fibrobacter sp. UWP2]MBO7383631.1 ParB/RepB/Spo0J family partition protein [Fibrobacter sp.]MCR5379062.1 ParB/RepB/Spo0J family partition protein [Fibrobacter sp.]SHI89042.1 chromosome partitioning protein, ParB family [Fibrobacter sp. UWP2]